MHNELERYPAVIKFDSKSQTKPVKPKEKTVALSYRGTSYEVPNPAQPSLDSTDQPKIKLIYRGNTFDYIPRSATISEEDKSDWPIVTLRYRGTTYERRIKPQAPYQKPRSINWRWQISSKN